MLKCELHSHTRFSRDCTLSIASIIQACQRKQITCLAVTDHNEIKGTFEMHQRAPFKVIVGQEITTSEGEIIGYFLREKIAAGLSPEETIAQIRQQGGVVALPHPFDRFRNSRMNAATVYRIINQVDLVEVFNSRNVCRSDDERARSLCRERNKIAYVGSDAHTLYEYGRSTATIGDFKAPQEFLSAMKQARFECRRSPLWVHAVTKYNKWFTK